MRILLDESLPRDLVQLITGHKPSQFECDSHHKHRSPVEQSSPDKNMNYHDTTARFTVQRGLLVFVIWCPLDSAARPFI